jgi:hypothetical protein
MMIDSTRPDLDRTLYRAEIFFDEGIDGHGDDQYQHQMPHQCLRDERHGCGAEEEYDEGTDCSRKYQAPWNAHYPHV